MNLQEIETLVRCSIIILIPILSIMYCSLERKITEAEHRSERKIRESEKVLEEKIRSIEREFYKK
jgi:hypothetical protein